MSERILTFLTLRPGDTDAGYFDEYTDEQMDFVRTDADSPPTGGPST